MVNKLDTSIYGNSGVGGNMAADIEAYTNDAKYRAEAIARTQGIIANRKNEGMDTNAQNVYLSKLMAADAAAGNTNTIQGNYVDPRLTAMQESAQGYSDAYFNNQLALLNNARQQQIAELEKAYSDAVAEGQISIRDAEAQFERQKQEIEKQTYLDSERTGLAANEAGIQNSQQMLAMMAGDNARANALVNTNVSERDKRINDIKDRIASIQKQKSLDIASTNASYQNELLAARSQADLAYSDKMFNVQLGDYGAERDWGYAQKGEALKHQYGLDTLSKQHEFSLGIMSKEHEYNLETLTKQFEGELKNSLAQMEAKFGYDVKLNSQEHSNRMSQIAASAAAEASNAINIAKQKQKMELDSLSRTYTPGTTEYNIMQSKIKMETDSTISGIFAQSYANAQAGLIENFIPNAGDRPVNIYEGKRGITAGLRNWITGIKEEQEQWDRSDAQKRAIINMGNKYGIDFNSIYGGN